MIKKGLFIVCVLGVVISTTRGDSTSLEPKCYHRSSNSSTKCHHPPEPKCLSQFNYYWPHTTDRDKFTACENGVRSQMSCPEGKFFDPVSRKCDDDWNIQHEHDSIVDCKNTYVTDSWDPHYYYICRNGVPTLEYCPHPYIFNINTIACVASKECIGNMTYYVWDKNEQLLHKCEMGVEKTCNCISFYYEEHSHKFDFFLGTCEMKKMEKRPHQCVRNKTYNWPHETRSDLYHTCTNGSKMTNNCSNSTFSSVLLKCVREVLNGTVYKDTCNRTKLIGDNSNVYCKYEDHRIKKRSCRPYEMFDLALGYCVWKNNVYFGLDQLPETATYQQHNCTGMPIYSFPHESRSDMYYLCLLGRRMIRSCPEGTMFHSGFAKCVSVHRTELTGKCEAGVYSFRHERDNLYYNCNQGYKRILYCPWPELFDWEARKCLYFAKTDCNEWQRYHIDNNATTYNYCAGKYWKTVVCPPNKPFHPKFRTCGKREFCDPERDYNETHEISPDLYYHCNFGSYTLKTCPFRRIFSMKVGRCVKAKKGNSTEVPLQAMTTGRPAR